MTGHVPSKVPKKHVFKISLWPLWKFLEFFTPCTEWTWATSRDTNIVLIRCS